MSNRRIAFVVFAALVVIALVVTWFNMSADADRAESVEEFNAPKPGETSQRQPPAASGASALMVTLPRPLTLDRS